MSQEVRAAIDGARSAGATGVLINDSHGPMRNVLWDELPDDVRMIYGNRKPYSMVQGISPEYACVFFTGYHGAAGDANAALEHTYTPNTIYTIRMNGERCSEATINAALAGYYGVPVTLITGDRTTIELAQAQMPWITGVIVKESIGKFAVDSISPEAARRAIRDGAREAMGKLSQAKPFVFQPPVTMEIDFVLSEQAETVELMPGFERTGGRTVRFVHDDYRTIFRAFIAAFRLGATANSA
jgi:D-amino peptidase